jgi:16S rRNA (uracil1498-N3)-methyltransferase
MTPPYFFVDELNDQSSIVVLDEEQSRHMVQVLRMKEREGVILTDGKGKCWTGSIQSAEKKRTIVNISEKREIPFSSSQISIAISLLKNSSRFEWFLEKATEMGVKEIIPMICSRTEKQKFRQDRMRGICVSAMLQSQQCWLPRLHEPVKFNGLVKQNAATQKLIAHCAEEGKQTIQSLNVHEDVIILIGPEGDFTHDEIDLALQNGFKSVSLGNTRLRSETAGMVAAALLVQGKKD